MIAIKGQNAVTKKRNFDVEFLKQKMTQAPGFFLNSDASPDYAY